MHALLPLLTIMACFHPTRREIHSEIEALQAENAALAQKVESLEARLGRLEGASVQLGTGAAENPETTETGPSWRNLDFDTRLAQAARHDVSITEKEASFFRNPEMNELSRSARFVPWRGGDGEVGGFRMAALRRGSPWDLAGFKNGDIAHAARPLSTSCSDASKDPSSSAPWVTLVKVENVLLMTERLRGANAIEVLLTRRGTPYLLCIGVGLENSVLERPVK